MKPSYKLYRECPGGYRIYYEVLESAEEGYKAGFKFEIWEAESCDLELSDTIFDWPEDWHQEGMVCSHVAHGQAYFDGIRHLYFGNVGTNPNVDNYNFAYQNYPDLRYINVLIGMEAEFCQEGDSSQVGMD